MRIEKPNNGLYQAKVAQDQIEVVSSDLVTTNNNLVATSGILSGQITIVNNDLIAASSALDTKIDSNLSKLRVRSLNSFASASFYSTTNPMTVQFVPTSNTTYSKKYSDTELRVSVLIPAGVDTTGTNISFGDISYSVNGGTTWLGSTTMRGASNSLYMTTSFLVHFNLGTLPSGNVDFRIGVRSQGSGLTLYVRGFSYQFIETMENA
jgi:hypothetical protein